MFGGFAKDNPRGPACLRSINLALKLTGGFFFFLLLLLAVGCHKPGSGQQAVAEKFVNNISFTGEVKAGQSFSHPFADNLVFELQGGKGNNLPSWVVMVHPAENLGHDYVYPVNPPYRFSGKLIIGAGYDNQAEWFAPGYKLKFNFLYRRNDYEKAWPALGRILWPKSLDEQKAAVSLIKDLQTGRGELVITGSTFGSGNARGSRETVRTVDRFRFKAKLSW